MFLWYRHQHVDCIMLESPQQDVDSKTANDVELGWIMGLFQNERRKPPTKKTKKVKKRYFQIYEIFTWSVIRPLLIRHPNYEFFWNSWSETRDRASLSDTNTRKETRDREFLILDYDFGCGNSWSIDYEFLDHEFPLGDNNHTKLIDNAISQRQQVISVCPQYEGWPCCLGEERNVIKHDWKRCFFGVRGCCEKLRSSREPQRNWKQYVYWDQRFSSQKRAV